MTSQCDDCAHNVGPQTGQFPDDSLCRCDCEALAQKKDKLWRGSGSPYLQKSNDYIAELHTRGYFKVIPYPNHLGEKCSFYHRKKQDSADAKPARNGKVGYCRDYEAEIYEAEIHKAKKDKQRESGLGPGPHLTGWGLLLCYGWFLGIIPFFLLYIRASIMPDFDFTVFLIIAFLVWLVLLATIGFD